MAETFEALGREVDAAIGTDEARVTSLLAERDALLAQLTTELSAAAAAGEAGGSMPQVVAAIERASSGTADLISRVAGRTDDLRRELREVSRGARATQSYSAPATSEYVNARR